MSAPWWRGVAPAVARLPCDGREHQLRWAQGELRAPDHPDLEGEQILGALAGQRAACLGALDAWARHADDLRVLVMASRGPADPVVVGPEDGPPGQARRPRGGPHGPSPRGRDRDHGRPAVTGPGAW